MCALLQLSSGKFCIIIQCKTFRIKQKLGFKKIFSYMEHTLCSPWSQTSTPLQTANSRTSLWILTQHVQTQIIRGGEQITATPILPLKSDYCFNLVADSKQAAVKLFDWLSGRDWRQVFQNFIHELDWKWWKNESIIRKIPNISLIPASQMWILAVNIE